MPKAKDKEAEVPLEPAAIENPPKKKVIILFPNGVPGHLQPRGYAVYTPEKHGQDFEKKAEEMRNRYQGIEVFDVPPSSYEAIL